MEGGEERGVLRTGKPKRMSQPTSERRGRRLKSDAIWDDFRISGGGYYRRCC